MERITLAVAVWVFTAPLVLGMQCEPQRLPPPPDVPPSSFGISTVTNGQFWVIGDSKARTWCPGDPFDCAGGAVHVFEWVDGRLEFRQSIVPPDIGFSDDYGYSIAMDDESLLVSWPGASWPGTEIRGGAAEYAYIDGAWREIARLVPPGGLPSPDRYAGLGKFVAYDDGVAVLRPDAAISATAFVFERLPGGWSFVEMLTAPDGLPDTAFFGENPTLGDGWLFLSAREDSSIDDRAGSVYAYRRQPDNTFDFVQKLIAPDPQALGRYGFSVDYDDGTLVVGAFLMGREHPGQGLVFVYGLEDGRWVLQQELAHSDADRSDALGWLVHVDGDLILARAAGISSRTSSGKVYRFQRDPLGVWQDMGRMVPNPPLSARFYGSSMTSWGGSSGQVIIGAEDDITPPSDGYGAAYFFDLSCGACTPDLDLDGSLTIFDLLLFSNLFQDGDAQADFDGDGELTVLDFLAFQTAFDAGC